METAVQEIDGRMPGVPLFRRAPIILLSAVVLLSAVFALSVTPTAATAGGDQERSDGISPQQAAKIVSGADNAFRQGRTGDSLRACLSLLSSFPTWWIPAAKAAVALIQSGRPIDEVMATLEKVSGFDPSGDYFPMIRILAAAERLSDADRDYIKDIGRRAADTRTAVRDPAAAAQPFPNRDDDLESRYSLARAFALEKAGQTGMAIHEYRYLISSRPFAITPKVRLAALLTKLGRGGDAAAVLEGIEGTSLLPSRMRVMKRQMAGPSGQTP